MKDDGSNSIEPRVKGKLIDVQEPEANPTISDRRGGGRRIQPTEIGEEDVPPESIPGGPPPPVLDSNLPPFQMESLPVKGLRSFIYAFCVLLFVLIVYETYSVITSLWDSHWIFAISFLLLVGTVFFLGIRTTLSYLRGSENLESLDATRVRSDRMRYSRDKGEADILIENLKNFYEGKPQQQLLVACLDSREDHFDDSEVLEHIEREFLGTLDKMAMERVSQHCLYTGTAIAISPWAVMDVGLALWRNVKLMEEISSIYGFRPVYRNRIRLLKMVVGKMAFVGGTQTLMDSAMEGVSSLGVGVPLLASFAQGVGASVYTARIGIATMQVTRPVSFSRENSPKLLALISPTIALLKENLIQIAKSGKEEKPESF